MKHLNHSKHKFLFFTSILIVGAFLVGCSEVRYTWGWYEVLPFTTQGQINLKFLIGGFQAALLIAVTAMGISIVLGLLVSLPGISKNRLLRSFNRVYVEGFRSIPPLVMILWVYYGLPIVLGISMEPFASGVVALVLCDSAFEAEIFRAGIQSIEKGQIEASHALGLSYFSMMRDVILPQAIRRVLPPLGNQFVYMLKMSSLISIIGYSELTRRANELIVTVYRPLEIYTVLIVEYLILVLIASWFVRKLERRMKLETWQA